MSILKGQVVVSSPSTNATYSEGWTAPISLDGYGQVRVSGTVTATVDESTLAKDATLTGGTQKTQVVDAAGHIMPAGDGYARPVYMALADSSGNLMPAGNLKTTAMFEQISDGTNGPVTVETVGSDGVSNTANALVVKARLKGYNGTTWDRIRSGITTVTNSFVGWLNMMPWAIYNATPSTRADGYGGPLQANNSGSLLIADALIDPPGTGTAVTISDSTVVAYSSIYVGTGGDVYLSFKNGGSLIKLASVPSGTFIYSQIIRVGASTTATNIVGFSA